MGYSDAQQLALAITPKISATISILSSLFITSEIYHDYRKKDMNPIKRALLGVTCFEICGSLGWCLTGWALPLGSDFVMASGSMTSCNIQAFLLQLVVGAPMFNALLQYLFYVLVKGNRSIQQVNSIEYVAYLLILLYTLIAAIVPMVLKQYNPMNQMCWINGYPSGCSESIFGGNDVPCERGHYSQWTGIFLFYFIIWCSMIVIVVLNVLIVQSLLFDNNSKEARWVVAQGMMYSCAFLITWTPSTLSSIMSYIGRGGYHFDLLSSIFEPLQGFWNMLILLRSSPTSAKRLQSMFNCTTCSASTSIIASENDNNGGKCSAPVSTMFEIEYTDEISNTMKQESAVVPVVPSKK